MTNKTKTISGTITGGYTLAAIHKTLSVTGTGLITGAAGASGGQNGGGGGAGVTLPQNGTVVNSGSIIGGAGGAGTAVGGDGGVGVTLAAGGQIANGGVIIGGLGAYGFANGGAGGDAVALLTSGTVSNTGSIAGGGGGGGHGGLGAGVGGAGVLLAAGGLVSNTGQIAGGAGGAQPGYAGVGGAGVSLALGGTVSNQGSIAGGAGGVGSQYGGRGGVGVTLAMGGTVVNSALIIGGVGGLETTGTAPSNTGGYGGVGALLSSGASLHNSGTISGGVGGGSQGRSGNGGAGMVIEGAGDTVANSGSIIGAVAGVGLKFSGHAGDGVYLSALATNAIIVNGSKTSNTALISGYFGIVDRFGAKVTVTNFGTIQGASTQHSVQFNDADDRLIAEAGSVFVGSVAGGGGALELADTTGTITRLGLAGEVSGGVAMTFGGFGYYAIDAGGRWTLGNGDGLDNFETMKNAGTLTGTLGLSGYFTRLIAEAGSSVVGAVRAGGGALELASATGTITNLGGVTGTLSGAEAMTFSGFGSYVIDAGGSWVLAGVHTLKANQTLTNAGTLSGPLALSAASDRLIMASGTIGGGPVVGKGGMLELAGGVGTITGLEGTATLSGSDAMTFSGFGSYAIDAGASWTLVDGNTLAAKQTLTSAGTLSGGLTLGAASDRLILQYGAVVNGAVAGGGGTLEMAGVGGTISSLGAVGTLSGAEAMTFSGFGSYVIDHGGATTFGGVNALASTQTLSVAGAVTNGGTINAAGAAGIVLSTGGSIDNAAGALISGTIGVVAGAGGAATVTNFGTIDGAGGTSVQFGSSLDRLVAETGADFVGVVAGYRGTLELAGPTGTISGLGATGTLSGAETMTFNDFGTIAIDTGTSWTLSGTNSTTSGIHLSVYGTLTNAGTLNGSVQLASRTARLILDGGSSLYSAVGDLGTLELASGYGTIAGLGIHFFTFDTYQVDAGGEWSLSGTNAMAKHSVLVDDGSLTLAAGATLSNQGGVSGDGTLTIGAGSTLTARAVANTLTIDFGGAGGRLDIVTANSMRATIAGFTSGESLDLLKIAATGASVNASDQLVAVDGAKTVATLQLSGNYAGQTFAVASDGAGGSLITVSGGGGADPPRALFAQAMAGLGSKAASAPVTGAPSETWRPTLFAARPQLA